MATEYSPPESPSTSSPESSPQNNCDDKMKKTLKDSEHLDSLIKSLDESRTEGRYCDVRVTVGNRTFTAHKAVLAGSSEYFSSMFNSEWTESTTSEINIEGDPNIFELLLDYMYKGQLCIDADTVVDILAFSVYMQVMGAMKLCTRYLDYCYDNDSVTCETAIAVLLQIRENKQVADLIEATVNYLAHHLMQFYEEDREEFLEQITADILGDVLNDKDVERNASEYQILDCILAWLTYDWENRQSQSYFLLKNVRLGVIPIEQLQNLTQNSVLQDVTKCRYLLNEVLHLQKTHQENLAVLINDKPAMFATRNSITAIMIVGGRDAAIRYFDENSSEWRVSPIPSVPVTPPNQLRNPASLVVDGILYVAGGGACLYSGDHEFKYTFHQFNAATQQWTKLAGMTVARERCHMVHMNGYIYALGGVNHFSHNFLNCVERYDMKNNRWETVAPLPTKFCHISAVVYQGQLLIYGAPEYTASPGRVRHTLLVYHVSMNRWEVLLTGLHYLSVGWPRSALVVEDGICYRVVYEAYMVKNPVPQVNQLQFHEKNSKVLVGDLHKQSLIPKVNNKVGAFRIKDNIFVNFTLGNAASYCHKMAIKIGSDQKTDVDVGMLGDLCGLRQDSNWLKDQDIMSGSVNRFTFHNL